MLCDFDGSQCTLMQGASEDQADWTTVKALETRESPLTNDHTTDTGTNTKFIYNATKISKEGANGGPTILIKWGLCCKM